MTTPDAVAMASKKRLAINKCHTHGFWSVSIDDDNGGCRISPSKCCGSWTTVVSWPISGHMLDAIALELFANEKAIMEFVKGEQRALSGED